MELATRIEINAHLEAARQIENHLLHFAAQMDDASVQFWDAKKAYHRSMATMLQTLAPPGRDLSIRRVPGRPAKGAA